jgi:hypothetical protein
MERNKDNQRNNIILEMVVWAFVIGIFYYYVKVFI